MTSTIARQSTAADIAAALRGAQRILVLSHLRPDGDCLGSSGGALLALQALGKTVAGYNASGVPDKLAFIPGMGLVSTELPAWEPDIWLFLDCGGPTRVAPGLAPTGTVINIDHHATNEMFGAHNWVDSTACAVGEQMLDLVDALGVEVTPGIATAICTAILTDTGGLRYSSVRPETFEAVARLARAGANPAAICQAVFESRRRGELLLIGRVYSRLEFLSAGRLSVSEISQADYAEAGGEDMEPDGLSGDLRAIEGVEMSILFHEVEGGGLRAGFRGKGNVDCTVVARQFGGGGHFNASGAYIKGCDYAQTKKAIIDAATRLIEETMG